MTPDSLKPTTPRYIYKLWTKYKRFIEELTKGDLNSGKKEIIWRDNIFTSLVTYILPVCLVALVPGVYMGIKERYFFIAAFDLFAVLSITIIILNRKLALLFRKAFILFMLYALALVLTIFLGLNGPGVIYFLSLSVLTAVIFPRKYAYWTILINLLVVIFCAFIIYFKLFNSPLTGEYNVGEWIAASSNLVFLSWICVLLISETIDSLEHTFKKERQLKDELQEEAIRRIETSEKLNESEGHYESLFILGPTPMWVMDVNSLEFLQVNKAAIKNYGYTSEEFLTMSIKDIKLEKDMENYRDILLNELKLGSTLNRIVQHRRKDGELFYAEVRINPISFNGKEAALVIARDMTEQMNFTNAIESQNARLREIAYIQSHVVRAPLARIMGLVDIMKNSDQLPDPTILSYLDQSAREFDLIIRDIMNNTNQA